MSAAGGAAPGAGGGRIRESVLGALAVLAPTSLLSAVFYYFGYVSAKSYYAYFGVSLSALDFSTTNYLVRSTDTFFRPMATLLLVFVVLFVAHHALGHVLGGAGRRPVLVVVAGLLGVAAVLVAAGLIGLYGGRGGVLAPISLGASGLVLEYALWSATRHLVLSPTLSALIATGRQLRRGLIVALFLLSTFWAVTDLAHARGTATARLVEQSLPLQSQAVVYSDRDLHLPGPQIGITSLTGQYTAYRFRYNGLRPLVYARDRWFLLPVGWTHDNGSTVIVLQDDAGRLRVDLAP